MRNISLNNDKTQPTLFPIRLAGTQEKPKVFDILRSKYVALTPEEWVRQHFVNYLIQHKQYPAAYLANEVNLKIGGKVLRADTVLYDQQLRPLMIIEYKAPHIAISQKIFNQLFAYNLQLHATYLVVSNGLQHYCCMLTHDHEKYVFLDDIPEYNKL